MTTMLRNCNINATKRDFGVTNDHYFTMMILYIIRDAICLQGIDEIRTRVLSSSQPYVAYM